MKFTRFRVTFEALLPDEGEGPRNGPAVVIEFAIEDGSLMPDRMEHLRGARGSGLIGPWGALRPEDVAQLLPSTDPPAAAKRQPVREEARCPRCGTLRTWRPQGGYAAHKFQGKWCREAGPRRRVYQKRPPNFGALLEEHDGSATRLAQALNLPREQVQNWKDSWLRSKQYADQRAREVAERPIFEGGQQLLPEG